MTTPEKYRERMRRAIYALLDINCPGLTTVHGDMDCMEVFDTVLDEITEATAQAFITYETERLGHPPTIEDLYRFQSLVAKRPQP